ncbi:hypothetical protein NIES37_28210 [Tolypothrix tenuis PCC 7101]|uniref:Uncharacterized protein n=1 Tax=Tolypothrix tenuis PCC 7101 TaxID=231146 RepID=A0A1Z4MZI8_9CYAN|nr:hypothetical protein [Aulosira sp. FACHB-113]BAY98843.1 hypothetical protein NIES37_28210 [Tolypothrix tenuis PCC 7101]BAZ77238.1 hypothetical protein NIES50_58410 [Aulosira laxa NIES-50]
MKNILGASRTANQARIFTALVLTGILSVGSGLTFIKTSSAAAVNLSAETSKEAIKGNARQNSLPRSVVNAVLQDLSRRGVVSTQKLEVVESSQRTWRNGCLELAQPDELCTQALVPGWRVVVSNNQRKWVYHTNQVGSVVRFNEKASQIAGGNANTGTLQAVTIPDNELPPRLDQNVVFRQISSGGIAGRTYETVLLNDGSLIQVRVGDANDSERKVRRVSLVRVQQFQQLLTTAKFSEFKNLSYPAPIGAADYITYTLTSQEGTVKYNNISQDQLPKNLRTVIKAWNRLRNSPISNNNTSGAVPIPANELPAPLDQNVVFRQISSGGFTGRTYETVLLQDGSLIRVRIGDANDSERSVRRVSTQQVKQFLRLLESAKFSEFKNLSYPVAQGAADYITFTLTSREGTVRYSDISQNKLPQNLVVVVNGWNRLNSGAK